MINLKKLKEQLSREGPRESDILPKASERRLPVFNPVGRVEQINNDEVKVADVRRHPIGLFFIYLQTLGGLGIAFLLIFLLSGTLTDLIGGNSAGSVSAIIAFMLLVSVLVFLFLILAARIYQGNQLIITDSNITQVAQAGLFNRKVSELSMNNVEDVTAEQHGILPTLFNYGTIKIETAGEQNNFVFLFCPNPNAYAKAILDARQAFVEKYGATSAH